MMEVSGARMYLFLWKRVCRTQVLRREANTRWAADPAADRNDANGWRGGLGQMLAGDVNACVVTTCRARGLARAHAPRGSRGG